MRAALDQALHHGTVGLAGNILDAAETDGAAGVAAVVVDAGDEDGPSMEALMREFLRIEVVLDDDDTDPWDLDKVTQWGINGQNAYCSRDAVVLSTGQETVGRSREAGVDRVPRGEPADCLLLRLLQWHHVTPARSHW